MISFTFFVEFHYVVESSFVAVRRSVGREGLKKEVVIKGTFIITVHERRNRNISCAGRSWNLRNFGAFTLCTDLTNASRTLRYVILQLYNV